MAKITVIVPVYNVEKYLIQCVESIRNQTFKDIEIILVDDGSTDSSGVLCDELATKDSRIKVIHQENKGLAGAKNTGLKYINGEYFTFVDADDYIAENMLEILYQYGLEECGDLIICDCRYVYCYEDREEIDASNVDKSIFRYNMAITDEKKKIAEKVASCKIRCESWGKLYKTDVYKDIIFPMRKFEDLYILIDILNRAKKIIITNERFYYYRHNRVGSIMTEYAKRSKLDLMFIDTNFKYIIDCMEFLEPWSDITRKEMVKSLRKLYWQVRADEIARNVPREFSLIISDILYKKFLDTKIYLWNKIEIYLLYRFPNFYEKFKRKRLNIKR